jgi:hypothetical protein
MRVGFNYPTSYNRYGADIGPNPHCPLKQWQDERRMVEKGQLAKVPLAPLFDHLRRNLDNLRRMRIEVVRFFLLGNGFNWEGAGPVLRASPPGPVPRRDWQFSPYLRLDPRFTLHLELLLKAFREAGLQIIPSFVDFFFTGDSRARDDKGLAPGGRADLVKDPSKRRVFLDTVLNPLLVVAKKYKEQIHAFEVINEPYWTYSSVRPIVNAGKNDQEDAFAKLFRYPEVTEDQMNVFIGEAIELIDRHGLPSTVGHRFHQDMTSRKGLVWKEKSPPASQLYYLGSRPQFHYYGKPALSFGDPYQIEGKDLFAAAPGEPKPFLGEFDSDLDKHGRPWPELQGRDTTLNRLRTVERAGCELALLWPDRGDPPPGSKPDPLKLASATRRAIVDYTGGTLPPEDE